MTHEACQVTAPQGGIVSPDLLAVRSSCARVLTAVGLCGTCDPDLLGQLAQVPVHTVQGVLDVLAADHGIRLDDAGFVTGQMREWLLASSPPEQRDQLCVRGVQLLEGSGRPITEVADLLLRVHPAAGWMLEGLHRAARSASDSARPDLAELYLEHALSIRDSSPDALRVIRFQLAELLETSRPDAALPHWQILLDSSDDGEKLASAALHYANSLILLGQYAAATDLLLTVLQRAPGSGAVCVDADQRPLLEAALQITGAVDRSTLPWVLKRAHTVVEPDQDSPGRRRLRLARAVLSVVEGQSAVEAAPRVRTMLTGRYRSLDDTCLTGAALVRQQADDVAGALEILDHVLARTVEPAAGSARTLAYLTRAIVRLGSGDLPNAERDARSALALAFDDPVARRFEGPLVVLGRIQAARGDFVAAGYCLRLLGPSSLHRATWEECLRLRLRATLLRSRGDRAAALLSLRACGRILSRSGVEASVIMPWWIEAVDLMVALGRRPEAEHLAARCAPVAERFGTPRAIGQALLVRGLTADGPDAEKLLTGACEALAASPDRLLHARAEAALGATLLRHRDPRAARLRLRTALDITVAADARPAAQEVRQQLSAAGGRSRRLTGRPADVLTTRELSVARLAADGRTNTEIAQSLFVTRRTIELHLTNVYRKLAVSSRSELEVALSTDRPSPPWAGRS